MPLWSAGPVTPPRAPRWRAQLAAPDEVGHAGRRGEENLHLTAQQVGNGGTLAAIWYVDQLDSGQKTEQCASQMRRAATAEGPHVHFFWIGLGVSDELGH